ncbi:MAG: dimethylargininase [Xanthomonadales bacterium]|nr:dimethylargininase [Xanthomonadales bacterium]NIX12876.1 dimethylargininase [Xanthomonadales bacterium]
MPIAITRKISPAMNDCELTCLERTDIDIALAARQHARYTDALQSLGCEIVELEAEADLPDSVFVEDTALVLDEAAILCRPGATSRQPEVAAVAAELRKYREIVPITAPGTLDGGDVLVAGRDIFAGLSSRSNPRGIGQLGEIAGGHGYRVKAVPVDGCLHLKSAMSLVAPATLLLNPDWVDPGAFDGYELIEVSVDEPHAANVLLVNGTVIMPAAFPRTKEILEQQGIGTLPVDVSEVQKAEGGVTCCSLVIG